MEKSSLRASFLYNQYEQIAVSAQKKESGELSILFELGLPVHLVSYMEICTYHLAQPDLSQWQVALHFNTSKRKVWNAYKLLQQIF